MRCLSCAPGLMGDSGRDPGGRTRPGAATEASPSPYPESTIGVVIFTTHRGEEADAILDCEGRWRCPALPVLDRVLNTLFGPRKGLTGVPLPGKDQLDRVSAWLKGRVRQVVIMGEIPRPGSR